MSFTYPALALAGALLAGVPVLIHLLNRRRRRRVAWAAMDFLLQSDRKNRTWVRLSEWLLLAARVVAIALAGLLAAGPTTIDLLEGFFGAQRARHIVLLDDSCSMQRRGASGTAWDEALGAIDRLAEAARQSGDELLVVRYADQLAGRPFAAVVGAEGVAPSDPAAWSATDTAAGPRSAIAAALDLCEQPDRAPSTYAYVLSDFAERSHAVAGDWGGPLAKLGESVDGVVLAACGDPLAGNLSVASMGFMPGPLASGVETRLAIEVVNHSDQPAPAVALSLRRNGRPLTAVEVGPLDAGQRLLVEAPVTLTGVGLHVLDATLPGDRLSADDRGWLGVEVPASQRVLLVDDSTLGVESRVFAAALRPVGGTRSGWAPRRSESLSDDALAGAAAVFVLDVERLSDASVRLLKDYIRGGGGALLVLGPRADAASFNRSIAGALGAGPPLVPWRLGPVTSAPPVAPGQPMLRVVDHPALRVLGGKANGFLPLVRLIAQRRLATDDASAVLRNVSTSSDEKFVALATRVDGDPLVVESRYGDGRVVALLTTAATGSDGSGPWSNLASLPIFPVLANDLAGWLAHEQLRPTSETIGEVGPAPPRSALLRWETAGEMTPSAGIGPAATLAPPEPGVYRRVLGGVEEPPFAAAIDPTESDLRAASLTSLRQRWGDVARVGRATELFHEAPTPSSRTPLYAAATGLLGLLAVERWLAYRNSYVATAALTDRGPRT